MIWISIPATKIKAQGTNKGHLKSPCLGNLTQSFATKYSWLCHNASSNWSSGSLRFPRIPYYDTCHGCLILLCFLSRHVLKHAQNTSRQLKKNRIHITHKYNSQVFVQHHCFRFSSRHLRSWSLTHTNTMPCRLN